MTSPLHVHVVDPDVRRRAKIAFELRELQVHGEIYESILELLASAPVSGGVLLFDEAETEEFRNLASILDPASASLPVALYCEAPSPARIVDVMREGAVDYLAWPFARDMLEMALRRLHCEGERRAKKYQTRLSAKARVARLSQRELDVLALLMLGDSNKQIAQRLGISPRTVEIHRGNLMRKLSARSGTDAVRIGLLAGLDGADEDCQPIAA
jgi:FixJ family two-component response regulator